MAEGTTAMQTAAKGTSGNRVLSPHLQIWGWTVTMAASITHRATGVALYSGTILLAVWIVSLRLGGDAFALAASILSSPIGIAILAGYCWALFFHLMNGIKHLYQDAGRGLAYKTAKGSAWFIYIASAALAAVAVAGGLLSRGGV